MTPQRSIKVGLLGFLVAAVCCFTPLLVGLLALVGLGGLIGYVDFLLWPVLIFFLGLFLYGIFKKGWSSESCCAEKRAEQEKTNP